MHGYRPGFMRAWAFACAIALAISPAVAEAAPAASVQQQAAVAKSRIDAIESELSSTMSQFTQANGELAKTRAAIAVNRAQLEALNRSIDSGRARLGAEAVFLYRTDGNGFAEALFSASSFSEFADRLLALSRIAVQDAGVIARLKKDRAQATVLTTALAAREREQADQLATVAARRSAASAALARQQSLADSLSAQAAAALQAAQDARSDAAQSASPKAATPSDAGGIAWASVTGRSGRYAVPADAPKTYDPTGIAFDGEATWYGNVRPNMGTASGRPFDENELTCAHKTLPFGTRVAVSFGGRKVIVTVTDRGPYGKGRVIDLTKRAASLIGLKNAGVGRVHCEVVEPH